VFSTDHNAVSSLMRLSCWPLPLMGAQLVVVVLLWWESLARRWGVSIPSVLPYSLATNTGRRQSTHSLSSLFIVELTKIGDLGSLALPSVLFCVLDPPQIFGSVPSVRPSPFALRRLCIPTQYVVRQRRSRESCSCVVCILC
jgi:hypothetical protein